MRLLALLAGLSLLVLVAGCNAPLDSSQAVASNEVSVEDNKFDERVIEVGAGTSVTWVWNGDHTHNVVGEGWASDNRDEGTFQHTFAVPGEYDYKCTLHGGMRGRVVVKP